MGDIGDRAGTWTRKQNNPEVRKLRILAAARHPGPAEALGPVVLALRGWGHDTVLVGMGNETPDTKIHGGSAAVFRTQSVSFMDLRDTGYKGDPVRIPAEYTDALINKYRPDKIVVGCPGDGTGLLFGIDEALVAAGIVHGIKVVQIVELWNVWTPRSNPAFATVYAVLDRFTRTIMVARGAPANHIVVTGSPALEGVDQGFQIERPRRRQEMGLTNERLLLYIGMAAAGAGVADNTRTTLGWVVDGLKSTDRLVFSRHPRDNRDYSDILNRAGHRLIETNMDSHLLLGLSDICLSSYSTMGLKAALMAVPNINILLENDIPDMRATCGGFPLTLLGGSGEANSRQKLVSLLESVPIPDAINLRQALNLDGGSAQRIAQLVVQG